MFADHKRYSRILRKTAISIQAWKGSSTRRVFGQRQVLDNIHPDGAMLKKVRERAIYYLMQGSSVHLADNDRERR